MIIEDSNSDDIDMIEEYDMVPLQSMMYGYDQMNMMSNMGMPVGYMQDINSNMETNQYRGINPWVGMGQFNYARSMNEFNQLGRMYRNEAMEDYDELNKNKSYIDKYQDQPYIPSMTASPSLQYNEVDSIVKRIEKYNPAIFRRLTRYGNSYVEAREIVSRIVKVSLMYRDE
ncbi:hypothetical protein [Clostridium estertheticum]|uniref:Uncharacterized protein n=1 Tax=Clostridium estertheticum subsp. estertheticum TaxID=1552 RepID=A0A1J0GJ99_9CLOT|nr:hypothetical protein [Clostridium estertheticum]APC41351.1 hypothetical protein A7L45_15320 [Clostridium estertheticum subsp. estertheticum]MBZ9616809.1 hypothetical protein [Clostridium estertheticum subsp. laramiense]WAG72516.1 hypothetical protein LL032_15335 [Clostridium estertheticum]